ncbi:hypothetical protein GCM10011390_40260 [Aureimonas endophytica]|uniref:Uncharacterized protein n=1 Tax=Aureimonas endophytica TaxID=2027858 RepID=A0A916ZXJ1_9HYPH|nr:hypothetical protein [Aureimonas endophytica]GGE17098.1 hypothetical protein GCM10011390_40260 [Aureimonas endophytica]
MTEIMLRVSSLDQFFAEAKHAAAAIDRGEEIAHRPVVGFEGFQTFLKVMTANRWTLLGRLRSVGASSIRALAGHLGRDYRGVHADVAALLELGLIEKDEAGKIFVPWSRITAELSFEDAA